MILSGLFDRYPRLKIAVAHMGGGLLPVMGGSISGGDSAATACRNGR
jgi:predicted TIM-barrel fold metal-dependent hydrolase